MTKEKYRKSKCKWMKNRSDVDDKNELMLVKNIMM